MKSSTGWMVWAALAAGFAAGWALKGNAPAAAMSKAHSPVMRVSRLPRDAASPIKEDVTDAATNPELITSEKVKSEFETLRALSDEEFAKQMLILWFADPTPENLLKRALFASVCDGSRALAFYAEYKKNTGTPMAAEGGQDLRTFMKMIGLTHGQEFMEHLLIAYPAGTKDLDSLMNGWVIADSKSAVAWLNGLPEGSPVFSQAAKGMIWGLAAMSPKTAMDVFVTFDPSERDSKMYHLMSSSVVKNHGIEGLNELVSLCPNEEEKNRVMMAGMQYARNQPPAKFVDGMAGNIERYPQIESQFSAMASEWASTMPGDALSWMEANAANPQNPRALTILTSRLAQTGHQEEIKAWLAENPQAPGRAPVEAGLEH